jgi:hypothetical protein
MLGARFMKGKPHMRSPVWMDSLTPERRARHVRQQIFRRVASAMLVSVFVVGLVLSIS